MHGWGWMRWLQIIAGAASVLVVTGCSEHSTPPTPDNIFNARIAVSPATLTIPPGGSAQAMVFITPNFTNTCGAVIVSTQGEVTPNYLHISFTPGRLVLLGTEPVSTLMSVSADAGAPPTPPGFPVLLDADVVCEAKPDTTFLGGFQVAIPSPDAVITSISPSIVTAGGPAFILTVNGTNFTSASVVNWNVNQLNTTFVSATQVTANVPMSYIAASGTAGITVVGPGISNAVTLTISAAPPPPTAEVSALVSIATDNIHSGNGASDASSVDMNGRFIAFASRAGNLTSDVINNTGQSDIFVRDTCRRMQPNCVPSTFLVRADHSAVPNADVVAPAITADGLHVAFESGASNFAGGINNGAVNIFLADVTNQQEPVSFLVSRDIHDAAEANGDSHSAAVNANGRFVAFESVATNLVFPVMVSNPGNIFLFDTCLVVVGSGCTIKTILVSADNGGNPANALSDKPSVSGDGRFVAFQSVATNLVSGVSDGNSHVYLRDTCAGQTPPAGCMPSTILVSDGFFDGVAQHDSQNASVSADGRFVAFDAAPVPASGSFRQVFVRDTCTGIPSGCTPSLSLVSIQSNNIDPDGDSSFPSISADGRFIAYTSKATQQVPGDTNGFADVFVRDTCAGAVFCAPRAVRVSVRLDGTQGNADSGLSSTPSGRFVNTSGNGLAAVFVSAASNLVDNDTNNAEDVFVATTAFVQPAATPTVTGLVPSSASHGGDSFILTVNGTGFVPGAQAQWNGSPRDTTYINNSTLEAFITFTDILSAGSAQITVVNPSPGGTSAPMTFTIN